jgi:hypothetical protein
MGLKLKGLGFYGMSLEVEEGRGLNIVFTVVVRIFAK